MSGYDVAHIGELDSIPVAEGLVWHPVRRRLGITSFGINAYTADHVGGHVVEDHDESGSGAGGHEELYLVVRGLATFTVGEETFTATAGTFVFVRDPALRRSAIADEVGTVVLAVGGEPGQPYQVSPWEWYFAAFPAVRAARWDEAIELLKEGLAQHPGNPPILYDLACAEARAGHTEDARAHLNEAIAGEPAYAERAERDPDLDSLHE